MKPEIIKLNSESNWWSQDIRRKEAVEMVFEGKKTYAEIAKSLSVHRNTLRNWMKHPAFLEKLNTMMQEFSFRRRLGRMHMTTRYTDFIGANVDYWMQKQAKEFKAEQEDVKYDAMDYSTNINRWMAMWRSMRSEERTDTGESETKVQHHVLTEMDTTQKLKAPFMTVVNNLLGEGLLKDSRLKEALNVGEEEGGLESVDAGQALIALAEVALTDTEGLVEELHAKKEEK